MLSYRILALVKRVHYHISKTQASSKCTHYTQMYINVNIVQAQLRVCKFKLKSVAVR